MTNLINTAGGKLITGGKTNKEKRYIAPTIILNPDKESALMNEEIFGPIMPVFPYKDMREVINYINSKDKPLAVYYFGKATSHNSAVLS